MPFSLYDYLNATGENEFKAWTLKLQKSELGKLNSKLDKLAMYGTTLRPNVLTGSGIAGVEKLRIQGQTQLRPLLTDGPVTMGAEFTLLFGAKEKGDAWSPLDAPERALANKKTVIADHKRRKPHERVS